MEPNEVVIAELKRVITEQAHFVDDARDCGSLEDMVTFYLDKALAAEATINSLSQVVTEILAADDPTWGDVYDICQRALQDLQNRIYPYSRGQVHSASLLVNAATPHKVQGLWLAMDTITSAVRIADIISEDY